MSGSFGMGKRRPDVPLAAFRVGANATKADLIEACYHLASIAHDGSCDDESASARRMLQEINILRQQRGARPIKVTL